MDKLEDILANNAGYEFGFHDDVDPIFSTNEGLTEDVVRQISRDKSEPEWMLNYRLQAFHVYEKMPFPSFGPDLSGLDLKNMKYYQKYTNETHDSWNEVPTDVRDTFDKIGIPEAEREFLMGSAVQYESQVVYHHMKESFDKQGVIFSDIDSALQEHPALFKKWFGQLIKPTNNKFAALNAAVWSGGTFIYVPKGVTLSMPLQSYYRMNTEGSGQFERTLIIVDEGAHVEYVEGCSASIYNQDNLHAAVVEVNVLPNAYCRYTTIQNWSNNVYSLETKRAQALDNAVMEWVDGNLGSKVTMKYPSVYLNGEGARGTMLSIAVAGRNIDSDTGGQMIHNAKNTSSSVISKSISKDGGAVDYRGKVRFNKHSEGSFAHVECDTIIMDDRSTSDTIPFNEISCADVAMEHEAKVSKISEEQLYYLMSRGISEAKATEMIVMSFIEPFTKELPMEYAVELNRLIGFEMEGSIG